MKLHSFLKTQPMGKKGTLKANQHFQETFQTL